MVAGVPETFLADVSTGNLATATSLDRPTETVFLEKQEAWREDLLTIAAYVLRVSSGAASGRLREAAAVKSGLQIVECRKRKTPRGYTVYEAFDVRPGKVELRCNFPAIREGDIGALVTATVKAMTLGQPGVNGIDVKAGVRKLYDLVGIENGDELAEEQYPEGEYDPDRTAEPEEPASAEPMPASEAAAVKSAIRRVQMALKRKRAAA
jgi:hypothetical protein